MDERWVQNVASYDPLWEEIKAELLWSMGSPEELRILHRTYLAVRALRVRPGNNGTDDRFTKDN